MPSNNYYKAGSYNIQCDRCGQKYKSDQCKKEWNGLITCYNCFEVKHPVLEPLPVVVDGLPVPDARPRPTDISVTIVVGYGVWGTQYESNNVIVPDLVWENWDMVWGGDANGSDFQFPI